MLNMNTQLFNFNDTEISVIIDENNNPLFIAKEICSILEISNSRQAIQNLDDDEKLTSVLHTSGQNRQVNVITESGLYSLVIRSNKPEAKKFKKWVTSEVLPSIRKHGAYLTDTKIEEVLTNPDLLIGLATQLKQEREEKARLQKVIKNQTAKIEFIDRVLDSDEKIDIGQCAKILELPFGRNTLFKELRERGVFFKNKNEPKQEYIQRGYFQIKEKWIERSNHDSFIVVKVLVTQRGLGFLSTLFEAEPKSKITAKIL